MDASKEYIKMCNCREIKERWTPREGDFFWNGMFICIATDHDDWSGNVDYVKKFPKAIWLPRQDQIQEMILKLPSMQGRALKPLCEMIDEFTLFALEKICHEETLESMERIWLEFYMWEKHKKIRNGKKWVKQNDQEKD